MGSRFFFSVGWRLDVVFLGYISPGGSVCLVQMFSGVLVGGFWGIHRDAC